MACEHKKVQSVNCVLYCLECGLKLPDDWLSKDTKAGEDTAKNADKGRRKKAKEK